MAQIVQFAEARKARLAHKIDVLECHVEPFLRVAHKERRVIAISIDGREPETGAFVPIVKLLLGGRLNCLDVRKYLDQRFVSPASYFDTPRMFSDSA